VWPCDVLSTACMNNIPAPKAGMTQREWAWRGNRIAFGCKHQRNKGEGAGSSRIGCGKILSSCPRGRVQRRSFVSEREMSLIDVEPPTPVAVANTVHMIAPFLCRDTVSPFNCWHMHSARQLEVRELYSAGIDTCRFLSFGLVREKILTLI
jgi:hypothetical protein